MNININDKSYPIKFGTAALRLFCKEKKMTIDQLFKWLKTIDFKKMDFDQFDDVVVLIYCGIKDGLRIEKRVDDFDLEIEDFYDFLDNGGDMAEIFAELSESMPADEVEKKAKGKKLGNSTPGMRKK